MMEKPKTTPISISTEKESYYTVELHIEQDLEQLVEREKGSKVFSDRTYLIPIEQTMAEGKSEVKGHATYWLPGGAIEYRYHEQKSRSKGYRLDSKIEIASISQDYSRLKPEIEKIVKSRLEEGLI